MRSVSASRSGLLDSLPARLELARKLGPLGVVQIDPVTGTPRLVARLDGFLTGPSPKAPEQVVLSYVRNNLAAFGLTQADLRTFRFRADYVDVGGTHHLSWTQMDGGLESFDTGLKAAVARDGRLINVSGSPAHGLRATPTAPAVSATAALAAARRAGAAASVTPVRGDRAGLVLFYGVRGTRTAWRTLTHVSSTQVDLSVVDAATGQVLWRSNLVHSAQNGTASAWEYYPSTGVPGSGGTQQPVNFPVKNGSRLAGPNAHVYVDARDDNRASSGDEIPAPGGGLDWSVAADLNTTLAAQNCHPTHACTWNKNIPYSWKNNRLQNAAQLYYYLNAFHDHLEAAPIGFTEAAGNFQTTNPSGLGKGGDAVQGQIMDGAATGGGLPDDFHYNNANMYTPPDGQAPIMQMYLFRKDSYAPTWPSGNSGDDASIVYHEYTHGLSGRLVTYPNGIGALNTWQSAAMGEAWSDWYALDYLESNGFLPDNPAIADVMMSEWITGGEGIRFQPIDCKVGETAARCPTAIGGGSGGFTYGDFGKIAGAPEVHSDGEIWAQTIWQLRNKLGSATAQELITRAMELSPADPSFLDMRNAILQADTVNNGSANHTQIWAVFRNRGMGYFASSLDGNDVRPTPDTSAPPVCPGDCGKMRGKITDSVTGKPLKHVLVGIAGHMSGFGTDHADRTDATGRYLINNVPFHKYADVVVDRKAYEPLVLHGVRVDETKILSKRIVRDWAALEGGARIQSFTKPDYTFFGCGPRQGFDLSLSSGWGSDAPHSRFGSNVAGPRSVVVKLPKAVDITTFGFDPGATCGDPPNAAVKAFEIQTRTASGKWITAYETGSALSQGRYNTLKPTAGRSNVRYVRLIMKTNRGNLFFMDMSELSVRGS